MAVLKTIAPLVRPLGTQEQAGQAGFTHVAVITADHLQENSANTAQTVLIASLLTNDIIVKVGWKLKTAFKDASDNAYNSTTLAIGDNSAVNTHITATEVNENGTEVFEKFSNTAVGPYTAADKITATFGSMAAKALLNIDVGEVEVYFQLLRLGGLNDAQSSAALQEVKP